MNKEEIKNLSEYRKLLVSDRIDVFAQYNKTLMTLSGGALVVLVARLEKFSSTEGLIIWSFLVSVVCFAVSMVFSLFSMFVGIWAHEKAISQTDDAIKAGGCENHRNHMYGGKYTTISKILHVLSMIALMKTMHKLPKLET